MARSAKVAAPNIDIKIERWPIERLIPRANNPRTHSRAQVASIAASMREWGWTNPILGRRGRRHHRGPRATAGGRETRHERSAGHRAPAPFAGAAARARHRR